MSADELEAIEHAAEGLLRDVPEFARVDVRSVELLCGDASSRKFYRLSLSGKAPVPTALLMELSGAMGPFGGGPDDLSQDDTFVLVQQFLSKRNVPVPALYVDGREVGVLIVEDVGEVSLWDITAVKEPSKRVEAALEKLPSNGIEALFHRAIDIIKLLQELPPDPKFIGFQRVPVFERYRREAAEFTEHLFEPLAARRTELEPLNTLLDALCETICSHPKVLTHVDYMANNLMLNCDNELVLIDFQDVSSVSPVRDIVSLINDRDMDTALGQSMHQRLLRYAALELAGESEAEWEKFFERYNEYLLHWDLRVSGRFKKLSAEGKGEKYGNWIPGTLRRLGRTLLRMEKALPGVADLLTILPQYFPEIREGIEEPWHLPEYESGR